MLKPWLFMRAGALFQNLIWDMKGNRYYDYYDTPKFLKPQSFRAP